MALTTNRIPRISKQRWRECRAACLFLLPALAILFCFLVYPSLRLIVMSFTSANFAGQPEVFVGLSNYRLIFNDLIFLRSLRGSILFWAVGLPVQLGLALFTAIQVNKQIPGRTFFRTVYYIPVIMAFVVVALLWKQLYNQNIGLFNVILDAFGVKRQQFLGNMDQALWCLIITYSWKTFGFYMMIYISGLQAIPTELYESAAIDGANGAQRFCYITFPMLQKTNLFVLVIGSINIIVKSFVPAHVMTGGGPRNSTTTLVYYVWKTAFREMQVGHAAAAAMVLFLVVMVITILQFLVGDRDNTR